MNKSTIYSRMFMDIIYSISEKKVIIDHELKKKMLFYGVKSMSYERNSRTVDRDVRMETITIIKGVISEITFEEFVNMFPLDKHYDGAKYESKDYFSAMDYLQTVDMKEKIGDKLENLLDSYYNKDITRLLVCEMITISDVAKEVYGEDLFSKWIRESGKEINTFSEIKNGDKRYLRNNKTGEIKKVKISRPRHLKVVR